MKVKFENSCIYALGKVINNLQGEVILRSDLEGIDNDRQITRAIHYLIKKNQLTKIGYGIYAKLYYSKLTDRYYLKNGFTQTAREAFNRLGIAWQPGTSEDQYNHLESNQIPVNPRTRLGKRFRRTLSYKGMIINAS